MDRTVYRPQGYAGYARAVVIEHDDHRDVSMAGVIATDEDGQVVGPDDMYTQTTQVYEHIAAHLEELGGGLEDVIRHRVFVITMDDDAVDGFHEAHMEYFGEPAQFPAGTLIEIDGLVLEAAMIEIEIEAVIPGDGWATRVQAPADE